MGQDSYAKVRVSEILEECHSNSKFFNKYIENQYDSLKLDKLYFDFSKNNIDEEKIIDVTRFDNKAYQ